MYTNFGKVIANRSVLNPRKPMLLRACLIRTSPVDFANFEDTLDNRIMAAYRTQRKVEVLRHWTNLVNTVKPQSRFGSYLEYELDKHQPIEGEVLRKLILNRQVQPETLNLEALTNLLYLTSQHGIVDAQFEKEAHAALRRFDLKDASPSNLADILYHFGKSDVPTEEGKAYLNDVLKEAGKHLVSPPMYLNTNGNNTMLYEEALDGQYSLLEYQVAKFVDRKGEGDLSAFLYFRFWLPLWTTAFGLILRRASPVFDAAEISPLSDSQRLQAFSRAFNR